MEDNNKKAEGFEMKDHAINFLLYSYFGITPKDEWELCVKKAIIRAYDDATTQGAYNTLFSNKNIEEKTLEELRRKSDRKKKKASICIYEKIDLLFTNRESADFNNWHKKLCEELVKLYEKVEHNGETFFKYGNAQKWVSMTIKYLCILDAIKPKNSYHKRINELTSEFHVPVDSYIIEYVWETDAYLPLKNPKINRKKEKYSSEKVISWSNWDDVKYEEFQASLKITFKFDNNDNLPLAWESDAWIIAAENRKKNENKKRFEKFFDVDCYTISKVDKRPKR